MSCYYALVGETGRDWRALADAVRQRRDAMHLTQNELIVLGGPKGATIRNVEQAARDSYGDRTLAAVEQAVLAPPGWVDSIIDRTGRVDYYALQVTHDDVADAIAKVTGGQVAPHVGDGVVLGDMEAWRRVLEIVATRARTSYIQDHGDSALDSSSPTGDVSRSGPSMLSARRVGAKRPDSNPSSSVPASIPPRRPDARADAARLRSELRRIEDKTGESRLGWMGMMDAAVRGFQAYTAGYDNPPDHIREAAQHFAAAQAALMSRPPRYSEEHNAFVAADTLEPGEDTT